MEYKCIYCLSNFKEEKVYNSHLNYCRYLCNCTWCYNTRRDEKEKFKVLFLNQGDETVVDSGPTKYIQKIEMNTTAENKKDHTIIDIDAIYNNEELDEKKKKPNKYVCFVRNCLFLK